MRDDVIEDTSGVATELQDAPWRRTCRRRHRPVDTLPMLKNAARFFFLRFLPRRLVPLLAAVEVIRLVQRLRRRQPEPVAPRRIVTSEGPPPTK